MQAKPIQDLDDLIQKATDNRREANELRYMFEAAERKLNELLPVAPNELASLTDFRNMLSTEIASNRTLEASFGECVKLLKSRGYSKPTNLVLVEIEGYDETDRLLKELQRVVPSMDMKRLLPIDMKHPAYLVDCLDAVEVVAIKTALGGAT